MTIRLVLSTSWTPARGDSPLAYAITLANHGNTSISDFRLGFSGPARIDPAARIVNASLLERISNHTVLAPPPGLTLPPGERWTITVHGLSYPLRHWSDGANSAYVVLADGAVVEVVTRPTTGTGENAPRLKGMAPFPPATTPLGDGTAPIAVVPWPNAVDITALGKTPAGLAPLSRDKAGEQAGAAFAALAASLFEAEAMVRPRQEGGLPVYLETATGFAEEAYELDFAEQAVTVRALGRTGLLYGLVTLGQIWRGARLSPGAFAFPGAGTIKDDPGLGWRGCHLDVARQFYASAEIARLLKIMAWNKLNRFHWHLSEDEAWRVEIDAYPELTEIGAWRGHGKALPPLLGSGPHSSGGYYSKSVIGDLVSLADSLGIAVIPEIDVPGHSYAAIKSLPWLADPDEIGAYHSVQGFPNNSLNPAHEPVYRFLETVIEEMLALFPAKVFHLGADEVPLAAWSGSPLALDMLERLAGTDMRRKHEAQLDQLGNHGGADHIEGSPTAVLQAEFLRRLDSMLKDRGVITGGWEEAAHGDVIDKASAYLIGWRNVEVNKLLADRGYNIVVSPGQRYYLDMANGASWSEPGAGWAGWSGPEETYEFDPRAGWSERQLERLWGVQACIWSESMTDRAIFDRLVFPRLSAIAETGWTRPERKSYARFCAMVGLMPILYGHVQQEVPVMMD